MPEVAGPVASAPLGVALEVETRTAEHCCEMPQVIEEVGIAGFFRGKQIAERRDPSTALGPRFCADQDFAQDESSGLPR
jgi:hypothetical protein